MRTPIGNSVIFAGPGPFLIWGWDVSAAINIRQDFELPTGNDGKRCPPCAAAAGSGGDLRRQGSRGSGAHRRQGSPTLRDWVHRFNQCGPDGLINAQSPGRPPKLSNEQMEELSRLVEFGPDPEKDGFAR